MRFHVVSMATKLTPGDDLVAYLLIDNWDDWFEFSTMYRLVIVSPDKSETVIGDVKIGQYGMTQGQRRPELPDSFEFLADKFFSVGQDDSYYENIISFGQNVANAIFVSLRDMAFDVQIFDAAKNERVTSVSLLRSVSPVSLRGQYNRIAHGGVRTTEYNFTFHAPIRSSEAYSMPIKFAVEPDSRPPTNIHVIIGRNGVGKTTILNNMALSLISRNDEKYGYFTESIFSHKASDMFANVVLVAFSAFDPFPPLPTEQHQSDVIRSAYIGLKSHTGSSRGPWPPKTPEDLAAEFGDSLKDCLQGARLDRWRYALEALESDPVFGDEGIAHLASRDRQDRFSKEEAVQLFRSLSSGHKIVLLTITRLVQALEEKTIVLLDEPEAHLHPPLLAAFIRGLSGLLVDRNGVAVIATHSPVVLQEVPKACVHVVRRTGSTIKAERPEIETFAENVGVLTREVFKLELSNSGFHRMIADTVRECENYKEFLQKFDGELGSEGRAVAMALFSARENGE